MKVMNGESLHREDGLDDLDDSDKGPSLVAVPKSGSKKPKKKGGGDLNPQPQN